MVTDEGTPVTTSETRGQKPQGSQQPRTRYMRIFLLLQIPKAKAKKSYLNSCADV